MTGAAGLEHPAPFSSLSINRVTYRDAIGVPIFAAVRPCARVRRHNDPPRFPPRRSHKVLPVMSASIDAGAAGSLERLFF